MVGQRRRWESNPLRSGCSRSPCRLAPASVTKCSRQESNLVFDLRKVACESGTLREHVTKHTTAVGLHPRYRSATSLTPRRGIEPRPTASKTVMHPPHPQGNLFSTTAARAVLLPARSAAGPCFRSLDSNQGQQLCLAEPWRGCRGEGGSSKQESNAIRYTIRTYQRADDWIRTSMLPP